MIRCRLPASLLTLALGLGVAAGAAAHGEGIAYWRQQLRSPDPAARVAAAQGLALTGNQAAPAVPELIQALDDPEPLVRSAVIHALQDIGNEAESAAIPLARRMATESEPPLLQSIARALMRLGPRARPAIPVIIDGLRAPDPDARRFACNVLGSLGSTAPAVVDSIVAVMVRDPDSRVRSAGRAALKQLRVDLGQHVDLLIAALGDESPDVRESAADWISEIRPRPPQAVDPLVTSMLTDESMRVREQAERSLRDIGTDAASAIPRLRQVMTDGGREQRQAAASVLGSVSSGDDLDVDALVAAGVRDRDLSVRLSARGSLVRMARTNPATFARFIEVVGSPGPAERRATLIDALGRLGEVAEPAVPSLLVALREGTEDVREEAARSLGRIGAPAVDALLPLRRTAAWDRSQRVRDGADRSIKAIRRSIERRGGVAPVPDEDEKPERLSEPAAADGGPPAR